MQLTRQARKWGGVLLWQMHVRRVRWTLRLPVLDPERLIHMDPTVLTEYYSYSTIARAAHAGRVRRLSIGTVAGGDWDRLPKSIRQLRVFDAIRARVNGADWYDTELPARVVRRPEFAGRGADAVASYLRKIDDLIEAVRCHGYRTQRELCSGRPWDEVLVAVARAGEIRFVDSRHRLAIAQALGVPSIPVLVTVRHAAWVDILVQAAAGKPVPSCAATTHPDFEVNGG
jgi:hypothetical protein